MRYFGHHPKLAKFFSADSYGLILVLVVVTYLLAVSFPTDRGQSVVLAIQIATVWLTLHTARAPRSIHRVATVAFVGVAALAVTDLLVVVSPQAVAVGFAVSGLLYLLAPIVVVRDIATRRSVERETVLGAIAAYLLVSGACPFHSFRGSRDGERHGSVSVHKAKCGGRSLLMTAMEFEIRVSGALPQNVLAELGGVRVVTQSRETVIQGPVRDQAAFIGIINRLQALGVELRGVRQLGTPAASPGLPERSSPFDSTHEPSERDRR